MREITEHVVDGDVPQNRLSVIVADDPGAGGASHRYKITGMRLEDNPSFKDEDYDIGFDESLILFQNGPIKEAGLNGVTQEVLLAIVIDRLRSFQTGAFPCQENANALKYCELALRELKIRTERRLARGVEGKTEA